MLKASNVILPKQVLRCASMSGAFGRHMDTVFTQSGLSDMLPRDRKYDNDG